MEKQNKNGIFEKTRTIYDFPPVPKCSKAYWSGKGNLVFVGSDNLPNMIECREEVKKIASKNIDYNGDIDLSLLFEDEEFLEAYQRLAKILVRCKKISYPGIKPRYFYTKFICPMPKAVNLADLFQKKKVLEALAPKMGQLELFAKIPQKTAP